jgi:23S rRNA (uracil1939-C5)-methyltransferase
VHAPQLNDSVEGTIHQTWGDPLLRETLNEIPFTYDVRCFFQTNPRMAERLQKHVVGLVDENHSVLDLYCGVGLFSIPLILKGHLVKGIELGNESIVWARKNAHALRLDDDQFSFEVGDVPKKLQEFEKTNEKFDTIILDPPRSGLSKKIWRRVLRLNPKKLIYVSCNLAALKRDLEWLEEYAAFTITSAHAFDLFPHTDHVETVVAITLNTIKEFPKGGY